MKKYFGSNYRLPLMLMLLMLASSCASPPAVVSPMPLPDELLYDEQVGAFVDSGDVIGINFYRQPTALSAPYTIGEGDVLRVSVQEHPELSRAKVLVLPDGCISIPYVERLKVAGKRVDELVSILAEVYKKHSIRTSGVVVSVEETNYRLKSLLSLTNSRGLNTPFVVRIDDSGFINLPFVGQIGSGRSFQDIQSDIIAAYKAEFSGRLEVTVSLVSRRAQFVYVMGEVKIPGQIAYTGQLNLLNTVAAAGGFLDTANIEDIRLFRFAKDGKYYHCPIDLSETLEAGAEQVTQLRVQPRDVIYVPKSGIATVNQGIDQYIRKVIPLNLGLGFYYPLGSSK